MWEIFQKILKNNLTPNQAFLLFGMKQKTAIPTKINVDLNELVSAIINVDPTIEQNMIQEILSQLGVTYPK